MKGERREFNPAALFRNWFTELHGRWWLKPEAMPEGAHDAVQTYLYYESHRHLPEAQAKMQEATETFRRITSLDISDLLAYRNRINKKP